MKNKLYIFSNHKITNFLKTFLTQYDSIFMGFESINYSLKSLQANIIFINNKKDNKLIDFKNLNENHLIFSTLNNDISNLNVRLKILKVPLSTNHIKNTIENFVQNLNFQFHDLSIYNEKLTNLKDNSFCYLTKVEFEILTYLIREKETSKSFIKENILNIKSNVETNSLESHLTRIRKKMIKVNTLVKIQTKSDKLLITT